LWDLRPHRFESLQGERARIRDVTSNEVHEVEVASLRALPSLAASDLDPRLATQHDIDPALWSIAQSREEIVRDVISGDRTTEAKVHGAAKSLGLSMRSVYRLLARYRAAAQTTSLAPRRRGPHKKRRRLGMIRERLIDEAIEHRYLVRPRTPMEEVYRNVVQRCGQLHLPAPARNSIKRIRALPPRQTACLSTREILPTSTR
jgi:hypothetical protein